MGIVLIVVGVVLLGFGAFVLLRFPDRPGGNLTFRGVTVSSKGAGLPIIVLGLAAIVVAVVTATPSIGGPGPDRGPGDLDGGQSISSQRPGPTANNVSPVRTKPSDPIDATLAAHPCLEPTLGGFPTVPREDIHELPLDRTATVGRDPEALLLTVRGTLLAMLRLEFDSGPTDVYDRRVRVADLLDPACKPVKFAYYDAARTSDDAYGRSVLTWQLAGGRSYQIDFDHTNSSADAKFGAARRPPVTAAELGSCLNGYLDGTRKVTFREKLQVGRKFGLTVAPTALFLYRGNDLLGMVRVEKDAFAKTLSIFELVDASCQPVRHSLSDKAGLAVATFSLAGTRYRLSFDHHAGGTEATLTAL